MHQSEKKNQKQEEVITKLNFHLSLYLSWWLPAYHPSTHHHFFLFLQVPSPWSTCETLISLKDELVFKTFVI